MLRKAWKDQAFRDISIVPLNIFKPIRRVCVVFDFNKPNIEITEISEDKKYGRFVVEPLERGYGTTLGNSLRRIMLSSLPGAAISSVKIDGVLHEFSSIPGVKEDVTEIIMNLKSLAIKNTSESDEVKTAYIEFEGEGRCNRRRHPGGFRYRDYES